MFTKSNGTKQRLSKNKKKKTESLLPKSRPQKSAALSITNAFLRKFFIFESAGPKFFLFWCKLNGISSQVKHISLC